MLESRESAAVEECACSPRDLLALWWCVLGVPGTEERGALEIHGEYFRYVW